MGEKFNDHTGTERRNDSSLSGSYNFELEKYQGQKHGNYHAGNIENDFHIGKAYMGSVGDCFYKGFPGIEDDIGNDRKRDSEAKNRNADQDHKQPAGIVIYRNKGNHPHAEIREPSEKEGKRNLQELDPLKVLTQNHNLTEDQEAVPDDKQSAEGQGRIFATDNICNGGGR